jgi:hypothetical protein
MSSLPMAARQVPHKYGSVNPPRERASAVTFGLFVYFLIDFFFALIRSHTRVRCYQANAFTCPDYIGKPFCSAGQIPWLVERSDCRVFICVGCLSGGIAASG